jgi:hypothetical protein
MPVGGVGSLLAANNRRYRPGLPDGGRQTLSTSRFLAREKWWAVFVHPWARREFGHTSDGTRLVRILFLRVSAKIVFQAVSGDDF